MKYVKYGNTAVLVSQLAFGAMTFGEKNQWKLGGVGTELAEKMIKKTFDAGINLYDTADVYESGDSEILLGRALKNIRKEVLVATKVRGRMGPGINDLGLSRYHIEQSIRGSLGRLDDDHVDIYQFHGWDAIGNPEEMLLTMNKLVNDGKILYPAVSNFSSWQLAMLNALAEERGLQRFESAQMNYSLLNRDIEHDLLQYMNMKNITLLAWSPLHGGVLSGKYRKGEKPPENFRMGSRGFFFPYFDEETGWNIVEEVKKIAQEVGATPSQVALAWIISKGHVAIIGARTMEQLEENLESINVTLKSEQIERLDKISEPRQVYPSWMIQRQNSERKDKIIS